MKYNDYKLKVYNYDEFGQIRILIIDDEYYFMANDVAKVVGYKRPNDAVNCHCINIIKYNMCISNKIQEVNFIKENDVITLISKNMKLSNNEKNKFISYLKSDNLIKSSVTPIFTRKEIQFGGNIKEIFNAAFNVIKQYAGKDDAKMMTQIIAQYKVLDYKIDFYIPYFHLAIEYDETDHRYRSEYDKNRQREIENYFRRNNSYINFIRVKEGKENKFIGELVGYIINFKSKNKEAI